MTLDPQSRQVRQKISVAPSPATSGADWAMDDVTDYFLNALEQYVPLKVTVYPENEEPTKQNSEVIVVTAYSAATRSGQVIIQEIAQGAQPGGPIDIQEQQIGDVNIPQTEIQVLTLDASGGTYTLSFAGSTTASINWNDNAGTIQTRLQALASIGAGGATVAGTNPFTITFAGTKGNQPQALITADASSLTTGGPGTIGVVETQAGDATHNEIQTVTVTADAGVFTLTWGGNTTAQMPENATADAVSAELQQLASIGAGNVDVQGPDGGPYVVTFQGALGLANQASITGDASLLVIGGTNEIQTVTVDGDTGTFRLSADGGAHYTTARAPGTAAATIQSDLQALTAVGANNCIVTADPDLRVYTVQFCGTLANQSVALLTADVASLTQTTVHVTACQRAQDGTTARSIAVGDHVEAALVTPGAARIQAATSISSQPAASPIDLLGGQCVIPAFAFRTRMIRLTVFGEVDNTTGANRDIPRMTLKVGSVTLLDNGLLAGGGVLASGGERRPWKVEAWIYLLNDGSPANAAYLQAFMDYELYNQTIGVANAHVDFADGDGGTFTVSGGGAGAQQLVKAIGETSGSTKTVDTTADQTLALMCQSPLNSASYIVTCTGALMEII